MSRARELDFELSFLEDALGKRKTDFQVAEEEGVPVDGRLLPEGLVCVFSGATVEDAI